MSELNLNGGVLHCGTGRQPACPSNGNTGASATAGGQLFFDRNSPSFNVRSVLERLGAPQQVPQFTDVANTFKGYILSPMGLRYAGFALLAYGFLFGKRWALWTGAGLVVAPIVLGQTYYDILSK